LILKSGDGVGKIPYKCEGDDTLKGLVPYTGVLRPKGIPFSGFRHLKEVPFL